MSNPKVSIVAPVYNVAPYLSNFIESVLGQTFTDWELLLVDDGSTDGSGQICNNFAQKDDRIRVFHKQNGGVSSARTVGLNNMCGEWVLMPDPDDELPFDSVETLLQYATDDVDLVSASYSMYRNGELKTPTKKSVDGLYEVQDFVSEMGVIPQPRNLDRRCCNKLFRTSIIKDNGILFQEDLHYREDILYNYQYLEKCVNRVRSISNNTYTYFRRDNGAAISLQMKYTSKSGGMFIAMTRCMDILLRMNSSSATLDRMKKEILSQFRLVIKLINKSQTGKDDRRIFFKKLLQYYSIGELLLLGSKSLYHRAKKM
ncbi:MAG: glycosyltransferase [bacterium]|nr:glycosyltransferase [bacterium]